MNSWSWWMMMNVRCKSVHLSLLRMIFLTLVYIRLSMRCNNNNNYVFFKVQVTVIVVRVHTYVHAALRQFSLQISPQANSPTKYLTHEASHTKTPIQKHTPARSFPQALGNISHTGIPRAIHHRKYQLIKLFNGFYMKQLIGFGSNLFLMSLLAQEYLTALSESGQRHRVM